MNHLKYSVFALCILITSCSASYEPVGTYANFPHGGYDDIRINANTAIVNFDGNRYTSQQKMRAFVLYRSAQVTLNNGYDYFVVTSNSDCPVNTNLQTSDNYHNYVTNPPKAYRAFYTTSTIKSVSQSHTATTDYLKPDQPCKPSPQRYGVTSVIKMFQGKIPNVVPNAYYATDVIAHIQPSTFD